MNERALARSSLIYVAGGLLAAACFLVIDAYAQHTLYDVEPPLTVAHTSPLVLALIAFFMLFLAPVHALEHESTIFTAYSNSSATYCANIWVFSAFLVFFGAIGIAFALAAAMPLSAQTMYSYVPLNASAYDDALAESVHTYVGDALVGAVVIVFGSAMTCLMARLTTTTDE